MTTGPYKTTQVQSAWTMCAEVNGGEHDGKPVVVVALKGVEDGVEIGPLSMTVADAIELKRLLGLAIDQAFKQIRLIEAGSR